MATPSTPEFNYAAFDSYSAFRHEYSDREDFARALNEVFGADGIIVQAYASTEKPVYPSLSGLTLVEFYQDMDTPARLEFESAFYEFMEDSFPSVGAVVAEHPNARNIAYNLALDIASLKVAIADGPGVFRGGSSERLRTEMRYLEAHLLGNTNTVPPTQPELKW